MTRHEESIARGRAVLAAVTASYYTLAGLSLVFGITKLRTGAETLQAVIQQAGAIFLFYFIWTGRQWARWVFAGLFGLTAIYLGVRFMDVLNWKVTLMIAYVASFAIALSFPECIDAFMNEQRRVRKEPNQPPEPTAMAVTPPAAQEPRQP